MIVLGVDPSYTRSGLVLYDTDRDEVLSYYSLEVPKVLKGGSNVYKLDVSFRCALWHGDSIRRWVEDSGYAIGGLVVEYPAVSSQSGGYLLPLQCMLYIAFRDYGGGMLRFAMLPPTAINSYMFPRHKVGGKMVSELRTLRTVERKRRIVSWVRGRYGISMDHDSASAVVLGYLYREYLSGGYTGVLYEVPYIIGGATREEDILGSFDFTK